MIDAGSIKISKMLKCHIAHYNIEEANLFAFSHSYFLYSNYVGSDKHKWVFFASH
jgi:hypothetical protein